MIQAPLLIGSHTSWSSFKERRFCLLRLQKGWRFRAAFLQVSKVCGFGGSGFRVDVGGVRKPGAVGVLASADVLQRLRWSGSGNRIGD